MDKEPSLDDFFLNNNVKPISNINEIDQNKDHYLFLGGNYCGHSQLGTAHFSEACGVSTNKGTGRDCYSLDIAKKGGIEIAKDLEIPFQGGVPILVKWDSNEKEYKHISTGRKPSFGYLQDFKDSEKGI